MPLSAQQIEDFPVNVLPPQAQARETIDRLQIYYDLLLKWQKAINLISPKTIPDAWNRHFIDSVQIVSHIPDHVKTIADLGSGAGFPGLVLAIIRPDLEVHLIESDDRKCQFLKNVSRETSVGVTIHHGRIEENLNAVRPDLVTARALASLERLFDYTAPWAQENADLQYVLLKGARVQEEIGEAQARYQFEYQMSQSMTDSEAQILKAQNVVPFQG